ncbi:GAF domain-containing protein [bacterium]|nr:MAG: GAF domain-containing protein [bacterium]
MEYRDRLIRAVQTAAHKLSGAEPFEGIMREVLVICVEAVEASGGTLYVHDDAARRLRFRQVLPSEIEDRLPMHDIPDDYGMAGEAFQKRQVICKTIPERDRSQWNEFEQALGVPVRSMVAVPLTIEGEQPLGVVQLINKAEGGFTDNDCAVLDTVASVATMAYRNARLSEEMARASSLLGMGKVSHDIGNLAASMYAHLSLGQMVIDAMEDHGKATNTDPKMAMYLETLEPTLNDLKEVVDRIVGYSHLISDMSAGRPLRPEMVLAPLAETIHTSAAYLEADARANHVLLRYDLDEDAPATHHDPLFLFRIVQNLVGNAIKAVKEMAPECSPDGGPKILGEVMVRYCFGPDGHSIEVHDTGPGMDQAVARRILSGNARSMWDKASGSGWGTKIVLELTATHDGKVEIDSKPGEGATFRVVLPHRP